MVPLFAIDVGLRHRAHMPASKTPSSQKMLKAAAEIGITDGLAGIGLRPIARAIGCSPSAVSHHFPDRETLLTKLYQDVQEAHFSDLAALLDAIVGMPRHMRSLPGFLVGVACASAHGARQRTLLSMELELHLYSGAEKLSTALADEFWEGIEEQFELQPSESWKWRMMVESTTRMAVLDRSAYVSTAWIAPVMFRFAWRLDGAANHLNQPDQSVIDHQDIDSDAAADAGDLRHPRAAKIVDAAVRLLSRGAALSHRAIAAEAGVPLASTTYFFASKADILAAAYREIYRSLVDPKQESGGVVTSPFNAEGKLKHSFFLFGQLVLALARDDALISIAERVRNIRGRGSTIELRDRGCRVDQLDGLIWALSQGAANPVVLRRPAPERALFFTERMQELASSLFGLEADRELYVQADL